MPHSSRTVEGQSSVAERELGSRPGVATHLLLVTADDPFLWTVFEGFAVLPGLRVTACSNIRQAHQICVQDPPRVIIVDLQLLAKEPLALVSLASVARPETHIVCLSALPVWSEASRFGRATVSFLPKPVEIEELVRLTLREPPTTATAGAP